MILNFHIINRQAIFKQKCYVSRMTENDSFYVVMDSYVMTWTLFDCIHMCAWLYDTPANHIIRNNCTHTLTYLTVRYHYLKIFLSVDGKYLKKHLGIFFSFFFVCIYLYVFCVMLLYVVCVPMCACMYSLYICVCECGWVCIGKYNHHEYIHHTSNENLINRKGTQRKIRKNRKITRKEQENEDP